MRLKQLLKCRRGVAIENAIVFILVIFSLCAVLLNLTLIGHYQVKDENLIFSRDVEIDQIGEDYLACVKAGADFTQAYENYAYEVSGHALTVWHKADESKTPVLYVEAYLIDSEVRVLCWRYSLPTPTA